MVWSRAEHDRAKKAPATLQSLKPQQPLCTRTSRYKSIHITKLLLLVPNTVLKKLYTKNVVQFSIWEQLLSRNVERFRGGLVVKAHRLLHHSTLGSRVTKKKKIPRNSPRVRWNPLTHALRDQHDREEEAPATLESLKI